MVYMARGGLKSKSLRQSKHFNYSTHIAEGRRREEECYVGFFPMEM